MKKEISEELIVKWVDNSLSSDESRKLDALLEADPNLQKELDGMSKVCSQVQQEIPASITPPYPDFFNSQLMRTVDLEQASQQPKEKAKRWWKGFQWAWAPAGAMALVLAFLAGQRLGPEPSPATVSNQQASGLTTVYFSKDSLNAEVISDADGNVAAIVIDGLDAISNDASFVSTESEELPVSYQRAEAKRFH